MNLDIKPIRTKEDHEEALRRVSPLFDEKPAPGTPEADFLDVMLPLIAAFEDQHYPVDPPTPIEAIKFRMEHGGLSAKSIALIINSETSRVYEILNGKRSLTIPMIRALHAHLGISLSILLAESKKAQVKNQLIKNSKAMTAVRKAQVRKNAGRPIAKPSPVAKKAHQTRSRTAAKV
jgi:HTH-type transcriptional regulator/antitoxin HigA